MQLWDSNNNSILLVWCWSLLLKVSRHLCQILFMVRCQFCPCRCILWRQCTKKPQLFHSSTMLLTKKQFLKPWGILCLESPWSEYFPNLLGLAIPTSGPWGLTSSGLKAALSHLWKVGASCWVRLGWPPQVCISLCRPLLSMWLIAHPWPSHLPQWETILQATQRPKAQFSQKMEGGGNTALNQPSQVSM